MPLVTNYSVLINEIDSSGISDAIRNLKNTFSSGVDGIPSFIVKECADGLCETLRHIINLSLKVVSQLSGKWQEYALSLNQEFVLKSLTAEK